MSHSQTSHALQELREKGMAWVLKGSRAPKLPAQTLPGWAGAHRAVPAAGPLLHGSDKLRGVWGCV